MISLKIKKGHIVRVYIRTQGDDLKFKVTSDLIIPKSVKEQIALILQTYLSGNGTSNS